MLRGVFALALVVACGGKSETGSPSAGTRAGAPTGAGTGSGTGTGAATGTGTGTGTGTATCASVRFANGQRIRVPRFVGQDLVGTDFTVESWVWVDANNADASYLPLVYSDPRNDLSGWRLTGAGLAGARSLRFQLGASSPFVPTVETSYGSLPEDVWVHVAVTWDQSTSTATLFVGGVPLQTSVLPGAPASGDADGDLTLGGSDTGGPYHLRGGLDEVRISTVIRYPGSFTPPARLPTEPNTLAHWRLDEGSGTTTADLAGGYEGTLESATWSGDCP